MLTVSQAEELILKLAIPLDCKSDGEILDLLAARGRILATTVISDLDFPHWDNSAMDGYAVRYSDVQSCSAETPVTLKVVAEIPAGEYPQQSLQAGQAARIFTGAVMPPGADTVVMQEDTCRTGNQVTIVTSPQPQAFVRQQGAFYRAGHPLLPAGIRLGAAEIAVLAAAQRDRVTVYRPLRVAILSTGNELVPIGQPLQPGQIVDSNYYALAALVAALGARPVPLGIVPDQPAALRQAIQTAVTEADVVLSSGGVSVGDYDYVEAVLAELGGTLHIQAVAMKPGKPLTVATFPGGDRPVLYFGLPGNPVSALVTFYRLVQPALAYLGGCPDWQPVFVRARTRVDLRSDGKRETYLWGNLTLSKGEYEFTPARGSHSSGNLINLAGTTGLAQIPVGTTNISAGENIQVLKINP